MASANPPDAARRSNAAWNFERWVADKSTGASLKSMLSSEPRAATILAGSMIDDLLARLIDTRMAARAGGDQVAPGAEFDYSTKCSSVREMGLISERMLAELRTLGRIRNEFAHNPSPGLTFDSPELASAVERLRSPTQIAADRNLPGAGPGVQAALERIIPLDLTGRRYWWTLSVLATLAILAARLHAATATTPTRVELPK